MSARVWYLDTSAFVKQLHEEPESAALLGWLDNVEEVVSSDLLRTEARRVVSGSPLEIRDRCDALLDSLTLVRLTPELFDQAGRLDLAGLRSLDALHLTAALALGEDLAGIVAYDRSLLVAAAALDIERASPA